MTVWSWHCSLLVIKIKSSEIRNSAFDENLEKKQDKRNWCTWNLGRLRLDYVDLKRPKWVGLYCRTDFSNLVWVWVCMDIKIFILISFSFSVTVYVGVCSDKGLFLPTGRQVAGFSVLFVLSFSFCTHFSSLNNLWNALSRLLKFSSLHSHTYTHLARTS